MRTFEDSFVNDHPAGCERVRPACEPSAPPLVARLLDLQCSAGNRATRLLAQRDHHDSPDVEKSPIDMEAAGATLGAFLPKKFEEQQSLAKWNLAGSGRSQGLIHVIDYAKARPSAALPEQPARADDPAFVRFKQGHPLTGQAIMALYGKDARWFEGFSKKLENLLPSASWRQMKAKEAEISRIVSEASDKREANTTEPVLTLRRDMQALKLSAWAESRWVIPRDESKKGRVEQVAGAVETSGKPRPDFAKNEIVGVTSALDELVGTAGAEQRPAKGFGQEITGVDWAQVAPATGGNRAKWEEQEKTFIGSALEEESKPKGLRVIKWGPAGALKYSTVMGGSSRD